MANYDVCNGDADGLFGLIQLRLAEPREARLVTGLKHDIELLARIEPRAGDRIDVLDLSLDRNRAALERALAAGSTVRYFDHHFAGDVPRHPRLEAHIDTARDACTSIIVDRYLQGRFRAWAIAAAYGDNLVASAERLADAAGIADPDRKLLRRLGESVNYNAYGTSEADVMIAPAELYRRLVAYADPLEAMHDEPIVAVLDTQRAEDLARARAQEPYWSGPQGALFELPDAKWSRRVIGLFANALAQAEPGRAHAVAAGRGGDELVVSVRAPVDGGVGAEQLCRRFGGGGRRAAGAIDRLPRARLPEFVAAFRDMRWDDEGNDA